MYLLIVEIVKTGECYEIQFDNMREMKEGVKKNSNIYKPLSCIMPTGDKTHKDIPIEEIVS